MSVMSVHETIADIADIRDKRKLCPFDVKSPSKKTELTQTIDRVNSNDESS